MMHEIIYETKFEDEKRLREIIARIKSRMESNMTGSGHTVAMLSAMAQFSPSSYYSDSCADISIMSLSKRQTGILTV